MLKKVNHLIYICFKIFKFIIKIGAGLERYTSFFENTIMHPSVKILADAKVENLAKNQDLISIGKDSVIRGQLLVFASRR